MKVFIFGNLKKDPSYILIGENGNFPSLEQYLVKNGNFNDFDFSKNQLGIQYFEDSDIFISQIHNSPLELRLEETLIPGSSLVVTEKTKIEKILSQKEDYEKEDYEIFSGEKIKATNKEEKIEILKNIITLFKALYQFLDVGYLNLENKDRVDDWLVTFQEPVFDIFVRYLKIPTSAGDIYFSDEFINNPVLRKDICIILMKILSNFLINNNFVKIEKISKFKSWENTELWYSLKKNLKILDF